MNNYMVFYTEGCSPKIAHFKSKKVAQAFVAKFLEAHATNQDDYWVDSIIEGKIVKSYDGLDSIEQVHPKKIAAYFAKVLMVLLFGCIVLNACAPLNPKAPRREREFHDK